MSRKNIPNYYLRNVYKEQLIHVSSVVKKIEVQNLEVNDKFKTVFYCESENKPEGQMCIYWGRTCFKEGDAVEIDGRFKGDVFVCWTLVFISKEKYSEREVKQ